MSTFTELQTVSNFSFLRGASHPEELVQQAATLGYSAIALTDHHSLSGVVRAHSAAKEHNISFITGCRVSLYDQIVINKNRKPEEPLETLPHTLPEHLLPSIQRAELPTGVYLDSSRKANDEQSRDNAYSRYKISSNTIRDSLQRYKCTTFTINHC